MAIGNLSAISLSNNQKLGIAGGTLIGLGVGTALLINSRRKKTKRKAKQGRYRKVKGRRYTPHTAGKRRDTSTRRVRYTKTGQPYKIMANGRARFISKKSAKSRHKRSGGDY